MSMIYECPNCHTPQAPGRTSCRHCGAEFDSPVPDDAFLPEGTAPEAPQPDPVRAAASEADPAELSALEAEEAAPVAREAPLPQEAEPMTGGPVAQEAEPVLPEPDTPEPPPSRVAPPAAAEPLPYQSSPYPAPAYQSAPTYAAQTDTAPNPPPSLPRPPSSQVLTRALLIAFPIVLVLVLGGVFFARSLDPGQDTAPVPMPAPTPISATTNIGADTPTAPAAPAAPPYVLNGTVSSTGTDGDPKTRRLVGRWESKNLDFYVFNENGTGTRGSLTGKGPQGTFLWTLVQSHLILYADKQDKLAYSQGPDEDTMFLRGVDGKYVQYSRTKT